MLQQVVFPLGDLVAEELDSIIGRGDFLTRLDVAAADQNACLVHVEAEGVWVTAMVDQGHGGVDGRTNHFPVILGPLRRQLGQLRQKGEGGKERYLL